MQVNLKKSAHFFSMLLWLIFLPLRALPDRPPSNPFISGDTFRSIANHIFDETNATIDGDAVKCGDIVFVNLSRLRQFFAEIHPTIKSTYILISHNHDFPAPGDFKKFLDDSTLGAWFTQNADIVNHPKLIPIPIGVANKHWAINRSHDDLMLKLRAQTAGIKKKFLLYVNFVINTAPAVRKPIFDYFKTVKFCSWASNRPYENYLMDLMQSKFVLSPPGNGLDCHRTWEALYMGSFPVVKSSTLDVLLKDLPVVIVHDWHEVTRELLERKYDEFMHTKFDYSKLYFDYWFCEIKKVQYKIRNKLQES